MSPGRLPHFRSVRAGLRPLAGCEQGNPVALTSEVDSGCQWARNPQRSKHGQVQLPWPSGQMRRACLGKAPPTRLLSAWAGVDLT